MPLVGYHLIGFYQEPISFTATDHKLLQRPEHRDRVASFFSRTPHRFNLIFHNAKWLNKARVAEPDVAWMMHGRIGGHTRSATKRTHTEDIDYFLGGRESLLDHDAINIIYTSNATGEPIIPMTPHMMAHRMGHLHLLMQEHNKTFNLLMRMADRLLFVGYDYSLGFSPNFYCPWSGPCCDTQTLWLNAILKAIITTRAGREHRVNGWEYLPEMMAQHINFGHVRMPEQVPDILRLREIFRTDKALKVTPPDDELVRNRCGAPFTLIQYGKEIDEMFDTILGSWYGQVIVT